MRQSLPFVASSYARAELVPLSALEAHDPELLSTKPDRTPVEYCWTATPAVCRYVLEVDQTAGEVTYLDADLLFFSDPQPLFDEWGNDSVLIVPHRYAPEHRHKELTSGTYNVEWLTFKRDADGLATLDWWHDRCIEWCYSRWEDGKLGDQKYLEEFPRLFGRVRVLQHPGGGIAPWNVTTYALDTTADGVPLIDGAQAIFYHYHSLRPFRPSLGTYAAIAAGRVRPGVKPWTTHYPVSSEERRLFWIRTCGHWMRRHASSAGPLPRTPRTRRGSCTLWTSSGPPSGSAVLGAAAVHPPGGRDRHRDSWRSEAVAAAMVHLTEIQLGDPQTVPPYRAFLQVLPVVLADVELPSPARFLDIGCGVGAYGDLLERYAPGRFFTSAPISLSRSSPQPAAAPVAISSSGTSSPVPSTDSTSCSLARCSTCSPSRNEPSKHSRAPTRFTLSCIASGWPRESALPSPATIQGSGRTRRRSPHASSRSRRPPRPAGRPGCRRRGGHRSFLLRRA